MKKTVQDNVLKFLARKEAVLTDGHFIYTKGGHGPAYIDMRAVAHEARWLGGVSQALCDTIYTYNCSVVIGPETLGRTLASGVAICGDEYALTWCDMSERGEAGMKVKYASFSPKFTQFPALIEGKRVAIVDDLLTTGSSIKAVSQLVKACGGSPVVAAVVVRRSIDVNAEDCGVEELEVLAEVTGFKVYTPEECAASGPCAWGKPVSLRPGHGHEWVQDHPDYPVV